MSMPSSKQSLKYGLKYWTPPLLYMGLIFGISAMEQPPLPMPEFEWFTIDKLYHFVEYAILGGLLALAFVKAPPRGFRAKWGWSAAALIAILYGASDEWHQTFVPGRLATFEDWVADVIGTIAGVLSIYLYYRRRKQTREKDLLR